MRLFISYSHADRSRATEVASAGRAAGHDVFIDDRLSSGGGFRDDLERELRTADAVIVLWTKASVKSSWVREEAELARQLGTYRPVSIMVQPPFGFREVHTPKLGLMSAANDVLTATELLQASTPQTMPQPVPGQSDFGWYERPGLRGRLTRWFTDPR